VVDAATDRSAFVTRFEPRYLDALADFYRDVWDPKATPDSVARGRARDAAQNVVKPGDEFPTYLFVQHGRILGHLTTIPVRLRAGGVDQLVAAAGGLHPRAGAALEAAVGDLLGAAEYQRRGDELLNPGLYLDMPAYSYHLFDVQRS